MIFDFEMLKAYYRELAVKITTIRNKTGHPLTLSEKILYGHLYDKNLKGWVINGVL